ncbi:MAG: YpfJ protein, zinc metalloprotease superfamily [uncultured Thiotrichaceae bacterium]|uniref:YpfJ protein, zinc metalloprotease superfamily n=1 Tax=uncultured Thiotrichaceae bacterium TaxID=298394 RepID=A0A6S6TJ41_9GAMM|nr:MAG: YpfJ protein, zinc metalloprotease superfamily [uncultured Thiotrichaceae bacterium]
MRWRSGRRSTNIEDRRSGGMGRPAKLGGVGLLLMMLFVWFIGGDATQMLGMTGTDSQQPTQRSAASQESADFVSAVVAQTEDVWNPLFKNSGLNYREPKLVLYNDQIQSACGYSTAASGPFYCPGDQKVYIDLSFFNELKQMGAPGDFAQAYVIGHEIAHHVQKQLGTSDKIMQLQSRVNKPDSNKLSVLLELQADCYAGVWAHHAQKQKNIFEPGDLEEGLNAAASIGDDRLQRMSGRRINPDSFTHGTSMQRVQWFKTGLQYGDMSRCDTFAQLKIR